MKTKFPAWAVLTVICVVAAVLAVTNSATKGIIAENTAKEAQATMFALLPSADSFETIEGSEISAAKDVGGNVIGYIAAATTQGFGGEIETTVTADTTGVISGISVGGSNFAETAGLGAKAKEPEFQDQFAGLTAPVALTKDGGEVDAIAGATITSRAVVKGVNEAMEEIGAVAGFEVASTSTVEDRGDGKYSAKSQGFGGPVAVFLTLDENNTITAIEIGDNDFAETEYLGERALEPEFQNQFIGLTLPVTSGDIDALAGATITTNAVLDAISQISDYVGAN